MKRRLVLTGLVIAIAFVAGFALAVHMTNGSGEVIARDVIAGGGGRSTAPTGHVLESTVGQPVVGVNTAGNGTTLVHGFHVMLGEPRASAARNWKYY